MDDQLGLDVATAAVQAQERLHIFFKQNKDRYSKEAFQSSVSSLEQLKTLKSEVEGSHVKFEKVAVDRNILQDKLRPLMLMHVPGSMTEEVKMSLFQHIQAAFQGVKGTCKEIVFAGLITCPWYKSTQTDRGLQAKYNNIFVVYQYKTDQLFTPVTPHQNEQNQVIEEDWFYASEVLHFCTYLLKGSVRFVESLHLPEGAIIHENKDWIAMKQQLKSLNVTRLKGFLEQCRGQAVGSVAKKKKSGQMGLKDGATLHNFCDSYRLLLHAHSGIHQNSIQMDQLVDTIHSSTDLVKKAHQMSCVMYEENSTGVTKDKLFETLLSWKSEVDSAMKKFAFTDPSPVEQALCDWQYRTRCGDKVLQPPVITQSEKDTVMPLLKRIGGQVSSMDPSRIIMIAQAGSFLYKLHTPQSDVDFVVIYADEAKTVFGGCKRPSESFEKRGPNLDFEYGAYEARLFAEMLWKGSVVILELVFAEDLEYTSPLWRQLTQHKHLFLTERAIVQYFGLIKNNMVFIENEKYKDQPRERKLFYQIFHKLDSLEYFLEGTIPPIKCGGSVKDFIMKIRNGPLEGEISRSNLHQLAKDKIQSLRTKLSERTKRLPENVDYNFLQKWLMSVRGWTES